MKRFDVLSFHPGRQHSFEQADQLSKYYQSYKFVTSLYVPPPRTTLKQVLKCRPYLKAILEKVSFNFNRRDIVDTCPFYELKRRIKGRLGFAGVFLERNEDFGRWLVKHYAPPKFCIGFDTASRCVFKHWKGKSFLILDLTVALPQYRRKLELGEAFTTTALYKEPNLLSRLTYDVYFKELECADLILCGSEFVKKSCLEFGINENKLAIVPYGVDLLKFHYNENLRTRSDKIKFIFAGSVGYRKGVPVLIEAWKNLMSKYSNIEIHFYGRVEIDIPRDMPSMKFHGFVDKSELVSAFNESDIFVFPTHFEGSASVTYEAMAMKLAVITTPSSGSVIEHSKTGLIVDPDSADELESAMTALIENRELREELAENAYQRAKGLTWDHYGKRLHDVLLGQCLLTSRL